MLFNCVMNPNEKQKLRRNVFQVLVSEILPVSLDVKYRIRTCIGRTRV